MLSLAYACKSNLVNLYHENHYIINNFRHFLPSLFSFLLIANIYNMYKTKVCGMCTCASLICVFASTHSLFRRESLVNLVDANERKFFFSSTLLMQKFPRKSLIIFCVLRNYKTSWNRCRYFYNFVNLFHFICRTFCLRSNFF